MTVAKDAQGHLTFHFDSTDASTALSLVLHLFLVGVLIGYQRHVIDPFQTVDVEIIQTPTTVSEPAPPKPVVIPTKTDVPAKKTAVPTTGMSRQSTVETNDPKASSVKIGNTLSKAPDNLPPSDEALPPAAEEYAVNTWPQLKNDVRIPYPQEAKLKGIEGAVIMNLYIAEDGKVLRATLVNGPGFGLNEAALAAAKRFEFTPARVGEKLVPVIIRYSYNFIIQK